MYVEVLYTIVGEYESHQSYAGNMSTIDWLKTYNFL